MTSRDDKNCEWFTRDEIEGIRAHLKTYFPNQSVERSSFNKICDLAVKALKPPTLAPSSTSSTTLDMSPEARLKDAEDDVLRLHGEKMKFFERVIELERELKIAQSAIGRTTCLRCGADWNNGQTKP